MRLRQAATPPTGAGTEARLPNLFVIGAPKAGTTFMHQALGMVPGVYMSSVKEPGYFISPRDQRLGLTWYLDAYFGRAAGHAVRGESTPWYLYSDDALGRIAALPAVTPRFVVMVRRPSTRARSMYLDQVRMQREARSFDEAVEQELAGLAVGDLVPDVRKRYVWGGLYVDHIERWRAAFGEDRVHVVVLEDLADDAERVWADVAAFLDHDLGPQRFDAVDELDRNPSGTLRWPRAHAFIRSFEGRDSRAIDAAKRVLPPGYHRRLLQRLARINRARGGDVAVDPDRATLDALDDYYRPEVERMATFLERPLTAWSAPANGSGDPAPEPGSPSAAPTPMRILHLLSRSHHRGAELVAVELADELDRQGHRNRLLALGPAMDGGHESGLVPLAGSVGMGVPDLVGRAWRLRRVLADDPVDVVLAHGGWAAQVAALAVPRRGPLLVWQRILGFPEKVWDPVRRRWWAIVAGRFDAGVALTDDLAAELGRLGFPGPVWVIANSRKPDRFLAIDRADASARLRAEVGAPVGASVIGFVGHLVEQKRPERALEVLALLRSQGREVHLVIAGDGPLRADLEAHATRLGVAGSVSFLGHRTDVDVVYGGVDLVLLTSEAEGIPGVAIEALMAGCPMVTVPVGGVTEVVDHGVTGLVLEGDEPALMAAGVADLLDDEGARTAMGQAGRARASDFAASTTAAVYAERLRDALAAR